MNASTQQTQLEGRIALVTGASSGIGRASALELARRGAKVVVAARRSEELERLVSEIAAAGGDAKAFVADVANEADIKAIVDFTVASYGRLDIAFNNAGTEGVFAPLLEQNAERFDQVFEPNVRGVFNSMRYEAEVMLRQGSGSIVNNASMGGLIGFENASVYIASKHAVVGMTKTASIEWFRRGVRVNALCPGLIETPFHHRGIWPSVEVQQAFAAGTPAGRWGSAEEMATIVAFLASDDASYVSGHALVADGGYSIA
ncbi:SDR family NAD(P)-dependent oxidoreductase [Paraburkholderia caballeronis]|uniref:NAD(P)-dependent dehydrogenase, short-chain alcohol dehydrogenase family n=1 Tax=Paraburkholderia caballeronis TaxID=416943 RepID=A0A1H7FTC8_9BURK|nr:glucose 1-dehydrogenase [Paraburkholderia caballeronis]PXW24896.1 NAD(P)-dependent dehydrogenase (short-subunit alcohol dehydrogenase family) [Paraburkholderia caballeronis]PXX00626.1 NAD(P)-dependent dehydrogenase (short-subunit alcohol dehydrogenase family) [Paraburkholderia caballeronis]RAJ98689.1 NAD(P)-dependent dehydrogenase (short-subunit alcohol dehydrogenase family) [Paraburkholderia caballeronis]SEE70152.1 NAD(P)-dependent dehydrogenase, short-chain alcohol dehydrogenase family [Pa